MRVTTGAAWRVPLDSALSRATVRPLPSSPRCWACRTGQASCSARQPRLAPFRGIASLPVTALKQRRVPVRRRAAQALFTGIVQGQAHVERVGRKGDFSTVRIRFPPGKLDGAQLGASVAINGTCLTITSLDGDVASFDIIVETLRATNLGALQPGASVNFERSARVGDEIGGHNVSGHVHTTAAVQRVEESPNNRRVTFQVEPRWMKYILAKGFIAVDGVSLTVGEVGRDWFTVYLIPETLRATGLGAKREGATVNLEIEAQTQAIVDTVEVVVARHLAALGEAQQPVAAPV